MIDLPSNTKIPRNKNHVAHWLFFVMLLVVAMIVLGGATRLTNSGLSITEWRPITGALPPLSHEAWLSEFEKYKQIPEFMAEHPDMDLKGFEFIYFMEWSHRQLGRFIGLAFTIPFFVFLFRKKLRGAKQWRFWAILILIGLQGAIGWWMVASGLTNDRVDVHPVRLATHLGLAFIILAFLFWTWRDQREGWPARLSAGPMTGRTKLLAGIVFLQIISGALVAGTHAGKTYNTWPLMDGRIFPSGYFAENPLWKNITDNITAIQFNHRTLAYIVLAIAIWVFMSTRKSNGEVKPASEILMALVLWQVVLGIATLLMVAPLGISLLHQFSSILVFLAAIWTMRAARYSGT